MLERVIKGNCNIIWKSNTKLTHDVTSFRIEWDKRRLLRK